MTHPPPTYPASLAAKSLRDFWADMGAAGDDATCDEFDVMTAAADTSVRPTSSPDSLAARPQSPASAPASGRPEPRRLQNNPIGEARKLAHGAATLEALKAAIERFDGCTLKAGARNTVVCDGVFDAPVMIIGEGPGAEEDASGLPFVGRAGQLLDRMLAAIGLSRKQNVYITNLVYWRPPGNRDPSPEEMQVCAPFLARQIELKKPKLLLTAGKFPTQALLGTTDGIMRLRGRRMAFTQDGLLAPIPCVPLLHPAYLLRRPQDKAKAWEDLLKIAAICEELGVARPNAL